MFASLRKKPLSRPKGPVLREHEVNGRMLPLTIREHARATRITLRIEPGGHALKLTIPPGLAMREVDDFLRRHQGWLMTKLAHVPGDSTVAEGSIVPIRGIDHFIERSGKLRGLAETLVLDGEHVLRISGAPEHAGRRVADHLKREAKRDLEELVAGHAATLGRKVRSISYKDTKSRWGSCSSDGRLSFSWRIAMAPPLVIDYLAAHEVAHLAQMNHSAAFWAVCEELCPRTDEAKRWLKKNGNRLQALRF